MGQSNTDWADAVFWIMLGLVIIALIAGATVKGVVNPNTPCATEGTR